eukprot:13675171-Alexandrium_andersonii.AAC.1
MCIRDSSQGRARFEALSGHWRLGRSGATLTQTPPHAKGLCPRLGCANRQRGPRALVAGSRAGG